jgi:hypothetical protein
MQSATEQKEVADQRAFNHCDGVRPGAGLYHSLRSHDINVRGLSEE